MARHGRLGDSGCKIVILIDPFLTRKDWARDREWKTDEQAVLNVIKGADYIFAGHRHGDHIGDIPFIAKRFGSKIIGSRTTANLAMTAGVDKSRIVSIGGGENLAAEQFTVRVIEAGMEFILDVVEDRNPNLRKSHIHCLGRSLERISLWAAVFCTTSLLETVVPCTKAPVTSLRKSWLVYNRMWCS
jgi:hypothetical protein